MTTLHHRLRAMALGWGSIGIAYALTGLTPATGSVLPETALDRLIPFNPAGIWLYLSFFLLVPAAYLCCAPQRLQPLRQAMQRCAAVAGLLFLLCPTTLHYPPATPQDIHAELLRLLTLIDTPRNCLPSLHGTLTWLAVWALWNPRRPMCSLLLAAWGIAIAYSIIQLRRHLSIDLSAGLLLGMAATLVAGRWRRGNQETHQSFDLRRLG